MIVGGILSLITGPLHLTTFGLKRERQPLPIKGAEAPRCSRDSRRVAVATVVFHSVGFGGSRQSLSVVIHFVGFGGSRQSLQSLSVVIHP